MEGKETVIGSKEILEELETRTKLALLKNENLKFDTDSKKTLMDAKFILQNNNFYRTYEEYLLDLIVYFANKLGKISDEDAKIINYLFSKEYIKEDLLIRLHEHRLNDDSFIKSVPDYINLLLEIGNVLCSDDENDDEYVSIVKEFAITSIMDPIVYYFKKSSKFGQNEKCKKIANISGEYFDKISDYMEEKDTLIFEKEEEVAYVSKKKKVTKTLIDQKMKEKVDEIQNDRIKEKREQPQQDNVDSEMIFDDINLENEDERLSSWIQELNLCNQIEEFKIYIKKINESGMPEKDRYYLSRKARDRVKESFADIIIRGKSISGNSRGDLTCSAIFFLLLAGVFFVMKFLPDYGLLTDIKPFLMWGVYGCLGFAVLLFISAIFSQIAWSKKSNEDKDAYMKFKILLDNNLYFNDEEMIFPNSDIKLISMEYAKTFSRMELYYGYYEISARHGKKFTDEDELETHFHTFSWYKNCPARHIICADLNEIERMNCNMIAEMIGMSKMKINKDGEYV